MHPACSSSPRCVGSGCTQSPPEPAPPPSSSSPRPPVRTATQLDCHHPPSMEWSCFPTPPTAALIDCLRFRARAMASSLVSTPPTSDSGLLQPAPQGFRTKAHLLLSFISTHTHLLQQHRTLPEPEGRLLSPSASFSICFYSFLQSSFPPLTPMKGTLTCFPSSLPQALPSLRAKPPSPLHPQAGPDSHRPPHLPHAPMKASAGHYHNTHHHDLITSASNTKFRPFRDCILLLFLSGRQT